ncbi:MAG: Sec-independent protein translocase protein TatB [Alphaproteobacteria bacterium]|nr:Sec-independent protein translocase protein TatB [Alphaproteobacteria bacterium]
MFDIGWQELTLVIVVAIIVIGPRELPGTLRTIGKFVRKMKSMAREFQGQMDEMAREADLEDVRKQVSQARNLNPTKLIKDAVDADGSLERQLNAEVKTGGDGGHDLSWMKTPSPQDKAPQDKAPQDQAKPETAKVAAPESVQPESVQPAPTGADKSDAPQKTGTSGT